MKSRFELLHIGLRMDQVYIVQNYKNFWESEDTQQIKQIY